jgi:hypothetical protein
MAGFGCFKGNFDGLAVAHLAHQNYFRRLPKGRAQCKTKSRSIAAQFPLMHCALFVAMHEFNGIFDGNDVVGVCLIDQIDDGRKS